MKKTFAPAFFLAFALAFPGGALAQIESVIVKKGYGYIQSGPASVALDPASNNYGFSADVNGVNVAGITPAPTVTGPINVAGLGTIHNNGRLVYSTGDHGWRWGNPNANDFGTSTLANLNSFFGSGVYTITVNGVAVALNLTGDAYPNAPVMTLSGGAWSGGKYVIDANAALTVTTNAFTAYGSHPDDQICAGIFGPGFDKPFVEVGPFGCAFLQVHQYHSQVPGTNTGSFVIPARTLQSGKDYVVGAGFEAMVDVKPLAALPGSINAAVYDVFTVATVSVTGGPAQVSNGQLAGSINTDDGLVTFSCFGSPTCTGIYTRSGKDSGCSNSITFSDTFVMTGVILDPPGAIRGTISASNGTESHHNGDGTCTYTRPAHVDVFNYSGTWDGRSGVFTITFVDDNGQVSSSTGSFTGTATVTAVPPVFPVTVTGSVTPTVANVTATFTPRPQDVGTSQKTFVFALVPATTIPHAVLSKDTHLGLVALDAVKDDPVPCVLAQLNSSGQLVGVTASTMQAYTTGVLNAQGQSVNILNNVSTPTVAGSTFFVGYGPDGDTMINTGLNRSAVSVPGAVACQPEPPQTGWWWNPLEGGRGFSIEAQGNNLFFAAFHYEANGRATWNVSPGPVTLNGSYFTSDLYNVTGGQTLGGPYHAADATKIGPITLSFRDSSHGTMTWPGGTVPIERQNLVPGGLVALKQTNVPETGWWWNPQESGRGFFIEWQKGYADIAGYMYDDLGKPTWYIAVYETPNPLVLTGNWWTFANGQSMGGTYRAATQTSSTFAPLTVTFTSSTTAVMTLPNGRSTNLVRQRF